MWFMASTSVSGKFLNVPAKLGLMRLKNYYARLLIQSENHAWENGREVSNWLIVQWQPKSVTTSHLLAKCRVAAFVYRIRVNNKISWRLFPHLFLNPILEALILCNVSIEFHPHFSYTYIIHLLNLINIHYNQHCLTIESLLLSVVMLFFCCFSNDLFVCI